MGTASNLTPPPGTAPPAGAAPTSPTMAMVLHGRALERRLEKGLRELELSVRKLGILGHLTGSPGASLTEVARRAQITVASVHAIVGSLLEAGIVASGSGGGRGRSARLTLTDDGRERMGRALALVRALDRETFENASPSWQRLGEDLRAVVQERFPGSGAGAPPEF